jgi:response regulator RpfG family c-di-GMP phosphodiesterase
MSMEFARAEIQRVAGTQFDPFMAEVMLENIRLFEQIHLKYKEA